MYQYQKDESKNEFLKVGEDALNLFLKTLQRSRSMNVIFLDIDGVLNGSNIQFSKSHFKDFAGIDKDKVQRLARIVNETNAILVLSSSWRDGWERGGHYDPLENPYAKYLDKHLWKKGKLRISDKIPSIHKTRGANIIEWLKANPDTSNYIILDDVFYNDYEDFNLVNHLIYTDQEHGLTDEDAELAIRILKNQI